MSVGKWVLAILFAATTAGSAFAQGELGRVSGIVRDQSNAFVAEAKVLVKNERTGDERSALTNNDGYFIIGSLRPSTYTIKVEKGGFAILEYTAMPVAVGQELALDFEIKPAGVQEAVTVVGTAPVLDVSSARHRRERQRARGAGAAGQRPADVAADAAGARLAERRRPAPGRTSASRGRANEQNVIKYDGIEGSAIIDASPGNVNGENQTPFKLQASLENVQEFRVESSSYPAEFGTGTGGQVSVITKSGGNRFHGSVFEYLRSDKLDAPNYFDSHPRPRRQRDRRSWPKSPLKQNQFGGSIGGPIVKDRLFFFGSYEGYRLDAGRNFVEAVPSAAAWARAVPAVAASAARISWRLAP